MQNTSREKYLLQFSLENKPFQTIETWISKQGKIDLFAKGIVHDFGPKVTSFFMFCVYQKQIEKKCLLSFYMKKKPFKTIKTTVYEKRKIRIFPKVLVHRFRQKFKISSILIFIQNRPRKSIWERSSEKKVSIILCNPCLLYTSPSPRD